MTDSNIDIAKVKEFLKEREEKKQTKLLALHAQAENDAKKIISMIIQKYNPVRIWLWGSVIEPELFREYSDIDIGIEGIPNAETFFKLIGDAMELTDFSLDIVQMEKIEPQFAEIIKMKGKIVYER
ncbi:MAG: nucleotidyltransferase domain-containing protein [Candidatus Nanoarchaeia archaeon]